MQQLSKNQDNKQLIPGGWTPFHDLTPEDRQVFQAATEKLTGVDYTPLLVSTQVVEGTNYKFVCDSKVVYPNAEMHRTMVYIFKPLNGIPEVTAITPMLEQNYKAGGWSDWTSPVDAESQQVFNKATEGLLGVKYTATAVSRQVVAGMNYMFKCNAKPVVPHSTEYKVMVEIFQPLGPGAEPIITGIIPAN